MSRPARDPKIVADFEKAIAAMEAEGVVPNLSSVAERAGRSRTLIAVKDGAYDDIRRRVLALRPPKQSGRPAVRRPQRRPESGPAAVAKLRKELREEKRRADASTSAMAALLASHHAASRQEPRRADREARRQNRERNRMQDAALG